MTSIGKWYDFWNINRFYHLMLQLMKMMLSLGYFVLLLSESSYQAAQCCIPSGRVSWEWPLLSDSSNPELSPVCLCIQRLPSNRFNVSVNTLNTALHYIIYIFRSVITKVGCRSSPYYVEPHRHNVTVDIQTPLN